MSLKEVTAREMNSIISPTGEMYCEAVDLLIELDWKFKYDRRVYGNGWWVNEDHPTKNRPVGDSKNIHFGAWDTLRLYVK